MSDDPSAPGTEVATVDPGELDRRISDIVKLAHSDKPADERMYQEMQPKLHELIAQKAGRSPAPKAPAAERKPAAPLVAVPVDHTQYPRLADHFDAADRGAWDGALPEMHKLGLSIPQVAGLGKLFEGALAKAAEERAAADEARVGEVRTATAAALTAKYGANWRVMADRANEHLRQVAPGGASKRLSTLRLSDGSQLGENLDFADLIIQLAERDR